MRKKKTTPWARRRRRVYIGCFLVLLLLAPAVVWRMRLKNEVRREFQALRDAGVPIAEEEYDAWRAQFPALTPVELFEQAAAACVELPYDIAPQFPSFRPRHESRELFEAPYAEATLNAMRTWVEANAETLRLLREARGVAGEKTSSNVRGYAAEDLVELCCATACVKAEAGDGAEAVASVLDGLALLRATHARPWSQSLARSGGAVDQLMMALASAAGRTTLPETALREIQAMLAAPDWQDEMRFERIHLAASVVREFPSIQLDAAEAVAADIVFGLFDRHMAYSMKEVRIRLGLMGKTLAEQKAIIEAVEPPWMARNISVSGPPMNLAVASAGIEVIIHFQKIGRLPESLAELANDGLDLNDFFAGGPMAYSRDGGAFVLYSIGNDLKDDGGSGRDDVAFRAVLPVP